MQLLVEFGSDFSLSVLFKEWLGGMQGMWIKEIDKNNNTHNHKL